MNAVIGLTDLLTTMSLPPEAQSSLSTIRASGEALLSIISDVLDYSKIESGHLQLEQRDLDLDQLVDDSVAVAVATARGKPLEFDVRLGADVPRTIVSDAVRVRQVLLNLLSNAVKYTPHGTIRVTVARGATGGEGVALHFSVEDQGIGLTEQAVSQLFKEFTQADASTTRRFGGTGLGLAISKRLVEALGGRIWVESTPGRGSTFHFTIIAASAAAAPPVAPFQAALLGAEADFKGLAERLARLGVPVVNVTQPSEVQAGTFVFVGRSAAGAVASLRAAGVARVIGVGEVEGADAQVRRPWSTRALSDLGGQGVKTTPGVAATHRLDVLVADDNVVNQRVSVALLESLGHRVDVVGDGEQAVKAVSTKHYDVVLMDVQMPVVDGLEATRRLRQAGLRLPILALTASASTEDEAGCRNAGMTDFLSKPVRLEQLKAKLGAMTPAAK